MTTIRLPEFMRVLRPIDALSVLIEADEELYPGDVIRNMRTREDMRVRTILSTGHAMVDRGIGRHVPAEILPEDVLLVIAPSDD